MEIENWHSCHDCGNEVPNARAAYCKTQNAFTPTPITCLKCGEIRAKQVKHCIVPMPKSNYIVVTDMQLLIGLNTSHKGGVR